MFKHLLVAVDGSPLAEAAFTKAVEIASETNAEITVVRACPDYHVFSSVETLSDSREEYTRGAKEEAQKYLESLQHQASNVGVRCSTTYVVDDHPYDAIIRSAEGEKCDLIVMASHGRRGVKGLLIGSETQKVLTHSKIPVLVYR
ncbi:universal stress protein [Cupriavidus necator]|uniref:Universal stress protein n=1 Tax=Cupriavidus necator TaxID=106590 RepID=A0A367PNI9_CUPNE|nr:universal stress protein [Cupriavidus necator]QQX87765.1 universal stress protein [Cupriavidus necator]RCJ09489.1 universal stress protein [Cupriavidus necator]